MYRGWCVAKPLVLKLQVSDTGAVGSGKQVYVQMCGQKIVSVLQ